VSRENARILELRQLNYDNILQVDPPLRPLPGAVMGIVEKDIGFRDIKGQSLGYFGASF
jgi:hypothetical protein